MFGRSLTLAFVALLTAALLVGCGGGGSSSSTGETGSSGGQDLVLQGNALCKKANAQRESELSAAKPASPKNDRQELVMLVKTVYVPNLEQMNQKLAELVESEGSDEKAMAVVEALEAGTQERKAAPGKALEDPVFDLADRLAKAFGWTECGKVS
jgi:hypothetical protein